MENQWIGRTVAIGGNVRLAITGPCPRCVMITLPQGAVPPILSALGTSQATLRAAILDRYWQAS